MANIIEKILNRICREVLSLSEIKELIKSEMEYEVCIVTVVYKLGTKDGRRTRKKEGKIPPRFENVKGSKLIELLTPTTSYKGQDTGFHATRRGNKITAYNQKINRRGDIMRKNDYYFRLN